MIIIININNNTFLRHNIYLRQADYAFIDVS